MKRILISGLLAIAMQANALTLPSDTTKLKEVIIRPYFSPQPLLRVTGAVGIIDQETLTAQPNSSFVSAANTLPGVRMEERSPGSYRLSVRGSLLRSPFGIRNIKIYFDGLPLTDAGGNTYINALDISAAGNLIFLKGPQSSIYGANSGGVLLIAPPADSTSASFSLTGGSYGLFRENAALSRRSGRYSFQLVQSFQRSDGYRENSSMKRNYVQLSQQWNYASDAGLKALFFYSDLQYRTPGGLTLSQYLQSPEAARPASGALRSAAAQQAGIYSKTAFGGLTHEWRLDAHFKHTLAIFASHTDFRNPFITNYEHRSENTLGFRTAMEYAQTLNRSSLKVNAGLESSGTASAITNYDNNYGTPAALQAADKLKARSAFGFINTELDIAKRFLIEMSASLNRYKYTYESLEPVAVAEQKKRFDLQLMPRAALSYLVNSRFSLRSAVSRGYSPPTIAEVRASDNVINAGLQPENGWNYEAGLRYQLPDNRLGIDLTAFSYRLEDAIVRRLNENGTEYFVNAGGTRQKGLEAALTVLLIPEKQSGWIRGMRFTTAYTLSHFRFSAYTSGTADLSGKALTGVPANTLVSSISLQLPHRLDIFLQHNYTSGLPLTDNNSVYAAKYHLLQGRINWKAGQGKVPLDIFAGADNILNQQYSLGNDLNAAGGRYYNAAARRNFYGGIAVRFTRL